MLRAALLSLPFLLAPTLGLAQESEPPMTPERLASIILALDPEATPTGRGVEMTIDDIPVLIFMDAAANRMRAIVPIRAADELSPDELLRVLQANFDTALDARYAIANGRLWSAYIHPLRELGRGEFIAGLAQTVLLAQTYGTTYSSGTHVFGAGDSDERFQELLDELMERGEAL